MAEPPKEDKKFDFSALPRGAISIRGLPVSRNTRLPSIRSPRDLTLGGPPKRTFMPNIPVRREKKVQLPEDIKIENIKSEDKGSLLQNDRGKGHRRLKQIIQTQSSIFSDGIAANNLSKKERTREAYTKSEHSSSSRGISIKKEKRDPNVAGITKGLDQLFRDDFIDDEDDVDDMSKPTVFPSVDEIKKEKKKEVVEPLSKEFNPDIAKAMDFDVNLVAKFIKKEKETEVVEKTTTIEAAEVLSNEVISLLKGETSSSLMLLHFPDFININQKLDDSETSNKKSNCADSKVSNDQDNLGSIKSLPEGYIGKLQIMKSGKVKLVVGSVEFCLDPIENCKSKHELASLNTDSNTGDLTVLGHLQHVLRFVPNVDSLLT